MKPDGLIIPESWYSMITRKSGGPDYAAITVLSLLMNQQATAGGVAPVVARIAKIAESLGDSPRHIRHVLRRLQGPHKALKYSFMQTVEGVPYSDYIEVKLNFDRLGYSTKPPINIDKL